MEASIRSVHDLDEDEDMESFLTTIKLHNRFVDDFYNEDEEFLSDEDLNASGDDLLSRQELRRSKRDYGYHSVLSSEAKSETLSMLDTARSSCQKSRNSLSLDVLNSKSDGFCDQDDTLLSESFCCRPPFGDPLSQDDILQSALSLLDEGQCQKFREVGLFDGFVFKRNVSTEDEKLLEDHNFTVKSLDLKSTRQKTEEQTNRISCNVFAPITKSEDVKEIDSIPPCKPELVANLPLNPELMQEQSTLKEIVKSCSVDADISANSHRCVNNDPLKNSNQGTKKKMRSKKLSTNIVSLSNATAKKSKKIQTKKTELASDSQLEKVSISSDEKGNIAKNNDGLRQNADSSSSSLISTALVESLPPSDFGLTDDDEMGEKFTIVLNKKKSRTRKNAHHPVDLDADLPKDKHDGHLRYSSSLAVNIASRPTPKSFRSNENTLSKRDSCSKPSCSFPRKSAPNSYASALSQQFLRPDIGVETEVEKFSAKEDFDHRSSEVETEGLLSPPQSEVDTGFSSASSLSTDEMHANSLTHDRLEVNLTELSFTSDKEEVKFDVQDKISALPRAVVQDGPSLDVLKPNTTHWASIECCKPQNAPRENSTQHRESPVFFDTRKPRVPDSTAPSDIVFGFVSGDECVDVGTDSGTAGTVLHPQEYTVDLKGVTFFADSCHRTDSADHKIRSLDVVSQKTSIISVKENNENLGQSVQMPLQNVSFNIASSKPDNFQKSVDVNSCDNRRERLEEVCAFEHCDACKDECIKNSSVSHGDSDAIVKAYSSYSRFDLGTAQKFLSKAFESILGQENKSANRILRF